MAGLTQEGKFISIDTALGDDVLLLLSIYGSESISKPFHFRLEMLSDNYDIKASEIVGKQVDVTLTLTDNTPRIFNGFITRFIAGQIHSNGYRIYHAEMSSWFYLLTLCNDCRIFQNMDVKAIIESVFQSRGYSNFQLNTQRTYHQREYTAQYRESDFQFITRLMEEEGIYYFFTHEIGKHTMVIADKISNYINCVENEANYYDGGRSDDQLTEWIHEYNLIPGKWSQTDYNFKTPSTDISTTVDTLVDIPDIGKFEQFDYPGLYDKRADGDSLTRTRIEEEETTHNIVSSASTYRSFCAGGKFTLAYHEIETEMNIEYVITQITHFARENTYEMGVSGGREYNNNFKCIPSSIPFRPAQITPKPYIQGPQTAVVVGPPGNEIYTDEYARVKVQFHWDRYGKKNEESSCWIRVSQVHAGRGFGGVDIPRIGEEVIVSCLEGDPDRPIITGRVYNDDNKPPTDLPSAGMVSGLKSNSTPGGGGYNQMTMDDTKGKEAVIIHAQKDMSTIIENDQSTTLVSGNRTVAVQSGTASDTIKGDSTLTVQAGKRSVTVTGGDYSATSTDAAVTLLGDGAGVSITGNSAGVTVTGNGGPGVSISGTPNFAAVGKAEASLSSPLVKIGDKTIEVTGSASITLTSGGSGIEITPGGVAIKGGKITLEGNVTIAGGKVDITAGMISIAGGIVTIN